MHTPLKRWLWLLATPGGINGILGTWLFISAFALPQTFDEQIVTWIFGILMVISSVVSLRAVGGVYVERMLAVLLGVAVVVLPVASTVTTVNDACVALAVFVLSFLRSGGHGRFVGLHSH